MYSTVTLIALALGCVSAQGPYIRGGYGGIYGGAAPAAVPVNPGGYLPAPQTRQTYRVRPEDNYPPQPYNFDFNVDDGAGSRLYRTENGDANGAVRGTYGYQDLNGVYRNVDYVADAQGFRANVRTNEPGVGAANPADVNMDVQSPPAGLQERYTRPGGSGPGPRRPGGRGPY